jgi:AmmeMemoRadiSam system protein A
VNVTHDARSDDTLVRWARARLRQSLGGSAERDEAPDGWGSAPAATFVTLRWRDDGRLQGCVGSLEPKRSLADDVAHNVVAAALEDPRAEPIELRDVDRLSIDVSVLSPLEPLPFTSEAAALAFLRPGVDGVVLQWRGRRATLLPVMWRRLPTAPEFMAALKCKAGLPPAFWSDDIRLWRYTVDLHEEAAPS